MSEQSKTFDPATMELEPWPLDDDQLVGDAPEVSGLIHAGDRTTWRVHETLRNVFQVTNP